MGFKMGIVGLPNVGKSTLFNALTRTTAAQAANFPFCTIEPNVGEVAVPDARLDTLAEIAKSKSIIPTRMTFVDIAGLVKGASKGEGLGNQFLANIREVDAIAHVLRCFEGDVTPVEGSIDPIRDAETDGEGGSIDIFVDDDGEGIPDEQMEEVFRPFYRLDAARNLDKGGTGLGLAIARDIARGHGGDITLARSPMGGLRAVIHLPV